MVQKSHPAPADVGMFLKTYKILGISTTSAVFQDEGWQLFSHVFPALHKDVILRAGDLLNLVGRQMERFVGNVLVGLQFAFRNIIIQNMVASW